MRRKGNIYCALCVCVCANKYCLTAIYWQAKTNGICCGTEMGNFSVADKIEQLNRSRFQNPDACPCEPRLRFQMFHQPLQMSVTVQWIFKSTTMRMDGNIQRAEVFDCISRLQNRFSNPLPLPALPSGAMLRTNKLQNKRAEATQIDGNENQQQQKPFNVGTVYVKEQSYFPVDLSTNSMNSERVCVCAWK